MADLSSRIANLSPAQRELLLRRMRDPSGSAGDAKPMAPAVELAARPEERFEPFPLTSIQQAYWVGRSGGFELGSVSCHVFREFDSDNLDLDRLERALRRVIERHEMLRAVVLPDGRQRILPQIEPYRIRIQDLRNCDSTERELQLETVRNEMSHQVLQSDRAPMFDFRASLLGERRIRLHVSIDVLIGDARSFDILFEDLRRFYDEPGIDLQPLELSFRDYVVATGTLQNSNSFEGARAYWMSRLASLPPAPELPVAKSPADIKIARFVRRSQRLPSADWRALRDRASTSGLTPSVVLLAAFAEVLRAWSRQPRFTVNLTLFNRLPLHPQVNEIVGDFTTVTLLEIDNASLADFEERARHLQRQLWSDLDYRQFSGVEVLRELARAQGRGHGAGMPVVFTSMLPDDASGTRPRPEAWLGESVYGISQTPQVWLDHMVMEDAGQLAIVWDAVDEIFPDGMLDAMFGAYIGLLRRLAVSNEGWTDSSLETGERLLPRAQSDARVGQRNRGADTGRLASFAL